METILDPVQLSDEKNFVILLNIFFEIISANKGTPVGDDERILDAEGLGYKFTNHCLSMLKIYRGISFNDFIIPIRDLPDPSSFNVLGRAALESFLTFHYIFNDNKDDDEKDFKYITWVVAGLIERQSYFVRSKGAKSKLLYEKQIINDLIIKIENNPYYLRLTPKQQKEVKKKGHWKLKSWKEIGISAGLSKVQAETFYKYLCGYAHSGNISVVQIRQSKTLEERRSLMDGTMGLMKIAISFMIKEYCLFFPKSKQYYNQQYPDRQKSIVEFWYGIGESLDSHN